LPATGGTCDARGLASPQTWSANPFSGLAASKPVTLLLGTGNISFSAQIIPPDQVNIIGLGAELTNTQANCQTTLTWTGSQPTGAAILFNVGAASGSTLQGFCLNNTGTAQFGIEADNPAGLLTFTDIVVDTPTNKFTNAGAGAAIIVGNTATGYSDLVLQRSSFRAAGDWGLILRNIAGSNLRVLNCRFLQNTNGEVQAGNTAVGASLDVKFIGSTFEAAGSATAIQIVNVKNLSVTSGYFEFGRGSSATNSYAVECPSTASSCENISLVGNVFSAQAISGAFTAPDAVIHSNLAGSTWTIEANAVIENIVNANHGLVTWNFFKNDASAQALIAGNTMNTTDAVTSVAGGAQGASKVTDHDNSSQNALIFGHYLASYYQDSSTSPPVTGVLRCGNNANCITWRNAGNSADWFFKVNGSNVMQFTTAAGGTGSIAGYDVAQTWTQAQTHQAAINFSALLISNSAPTISSGFGTSPSIVASNGTAAFEINVGTGGTATSGVIGLPAAANGWSVECTDVTTNSTTVFVTKQTAFTATTATVGNFSDVAAAAAWTASDKLLCSAFAF
jgi:hypothetical protein